MSRIGNKVIVMPAGVSASLEGETLTIKGPKGTLSEKVDKCVAVKIEGNELSFSVAHAQADASAKHGLARALAHNMVVGVSEGFKRTLLISGVGYKASVSGNKLVLGLGFSHPIEVVIPSDLQVACPSATEITISGIDKQKVGQFASNIKDLRPVEPYHGYGVRYDDQVVIRKVGKTAGKGKK